MNNSGTLDLLYVTADDREAEGAEANLPEHAEIEVSTAGTVDGALRSLERGSFDCVVSDHDMPDVSGVVFLQAVRVEQPDLPFLLYTREGDEELASRAITARVTDYLVKEEHEQWGRLAELVERAVDYHRVRGDSTRPEPILEAMFDPVSVVSGDEVVYANGATENVFGVEAGAIVGKDISERFEDSDEVAELISKVQEGSDYVESLEHLLRGAGSAVTVEVDVVRVEWEGESAALVVLHDVSRRTSVEERLREVARVNDVIRKVNRAIVNASSREEIESRVCEKFAESDTYRFAWIAEAAESGGVEPRASAGVGDDYLDDVEITVDEEEPRGRGPTGRAFRSGEIETMQNIHEDERYEPWRDEASERGYMSSAAVPLVHDGELKGVLNLYAERPEAFDEREIELLEEVAADVAFALESMETREEAETAKRRYDAVFEDPNTLTALLDVDGTVLEVNETAAEYVDADAEEMEGLPFWDTAWWRGSRDEIRDKVLEAADGSYVEYEIEHGGEGTDQYVSRGVIYPVRDGDGEIDSLVVLAQDVTEEKEREHELERYETYLESSTDVIAHLDEEGKAVYHSPAAERVLGIEEDGWVGETAFERVHPDDRERVMQKFTSIIESEGDSFEKTEHRLRHEDGSYVWVESVGHNVRDTETGGIVVSSREITERRRRERELRQREERLSLALDASEAGVWDWDLRTDEVVWDDSLERMFGLEPGGFEGTLEAFESYVHPEDSEEVWEDLERSMETGERFDVEYRAVDEEGEGLWIHGVGAPLTDDEGEVVRFIGIDLDITERKERERELERFKAFVENVSEVITVTDENGVIEYVSPSAEKVIGHQTGEIVGKPALEFVHPEDEREVEETFTEIMENPGEHFTGEYRFLTSDGSYTWVEATTINLLEDEEVNGVVQVARDVSERKRRQAEIERSRDLLNHAEQLADTGGWELDTSTKELRWTKGTRAIHGVDEGYEPTLEEALEFYVPGDREAIEEAVEECLESGEGYNLELRIETADGEIRWVRTAGEAVEEDGEVVKVRGGIRDVTDLKRRRSELRRRLRAIEKAPVGITVTDPEREDNPLVYVNERFREMTGYDEDEVLGRNCRFLQGEHTEEQPVAKMREAVDAEEPVEVELRNYREDGQEFWNLVGITPVFGEEGDLINFVGYQRDVSERKEREQHLRVVDRVLRHNLRNDLNIVRGYAENLGERTTEDFSDLTGGIVDKVDELLRKADKERRILDILTKNPSFDEVTVEEVVNRAAEAVRQEHPEAVISTEVSVSGSVGVTEQFDEALQELVENAVIHNDAESPEVVVSAAREDDEIRIDVADDGPRIPEMEVGVLTEEAEGPLYHGSGLGLWFVHWVVRRSNGRLSVEENEPRGNVVTVTLDAEEPGYLEEDDK